MALLPDTVVLAKSAEDGGQMVVDALDTVVQIGKLGLLSGNGGRILVGNYVVIGILDLGLTSAAKVHLPLGLLLLLLLLVMLVLLVGVLLMGCIAVVVLGVVRTAIMMAVVGQNNKLEHFEGIRRIGGGGSDTDVVSGRKADLVALEAWAPGNFDAEFLVGLPNLDLGGTAEVPVTKAALTKSQAVYVVLGPIIGGAVVEEAAKHTARPAVLVDHQSQTIEPADCVDALGPDHMGTVPASQMLRLPPPRSGPFRTKLDIGDPVLLVELI